MRKMKKRFLTLFLLMLAIGGMFTILTPTTQQTLDAWQDDVRMFRQKVHYRLGWPLPGTPVLARVTVSSQARTRKASAYRDRICSR